MKGYWNGQPATFVGVEYEVKEPEVPTWWQGQFVGEVRQGLEISYQGSTWIIDNQYGDGFYKLTLGMGSPNCSHKSVSNISDDDFTYIPDEDVNRVLDREMFQVEHESNQCWLRDNFPEQFKKTQALLKHIKSINK